MSDWVCASCGGENPERMRFCGHCGAEAVIEWMCASCGGSNPPGMRYCGHCGAPAATASPTTRVAEPEPAEPDVTEALRSFVTGQVADRLVEAGGHIPEERRLITALFADVSGFTSLAERLDPEQLLEVIDPVISGLSSLVGRYGGYVEKFAGDALLALFGAPVSHEDDAERALRVALEMHRELARLCDELPHEAELTLHVGVNSGHAIARILGSEARMDYAVLGDSVILAQRLESAAPPRETYVSEMTMRLAENRFEFEPVGELTLKGKAEPVPAWRLIRERAALGRGTEATSPLVGREREFAEAGTVIAALAAGSGSVLSVTGEPGVGKSRLTTAVRERALFGECRWLDTRCLSYGGSNAYWPYAELLRAFASVDIDDSPQRAAEKLTSSLAEVGAPEILPYFAHLLGLPGAEGEVARLEPEAFRRELHQSFATWVNALAEERPLIIAIEDVHWADISTLALTTELAQMCVDRPFVLYLIARPEAESILDEVAPLRRAIGLEPLDETAAESLIETLLGGGAPPELPRFVAERAGGNPLFVEVLIRSLQETSVLARIDGRWTMRRGWDAREVPPTLEGVLAARIDLLDRRSASVLQTASVIGRRVRVPLLATVADEPRLGDLLQMLVERGFLDRAGENGEATVVFHHALVQDVAYSRLLRRRQRDLHRRVAEEAERLYGAGDDVVDLLARHLYLGEAGEKAIDYLVRAGERAKRLYANDEAIVHFERAVELSHESAEMRLELADLYELVGRYDSALHTYGAIRDSRPEEVQAWAGMASTLRKRGEYAQALDVAEEAFRSNALAGADLAPIWLEKGWTLSVAGRFGEAIDALDMGLSATADRTSATAAYTLLQLARAETVEGRLESALAHATEAEQIFGESDDVRGLATTMRLLGDLRRNRGELEEAARVLRRGFEFAVKTGSVEEMGGCLINLGLVELERGDVQESIASTRRAIDEFERIGQASGLALGYGNLAYALSRAQAYDEAFGHAERALEIAESIGNAMAVADIRDTIAEILLGQERFAEAAAEADAAAGQFLEMGATTMATKALRVAAEAWTKAGEPERARHSDERARNIVPA